MNNTLAECPVPCLQHEGELQEFLEIYKEMSPKKVAEIGSFFGGTLWFFVKNNPNIETLISIDMPIPPSDERYNQMMECKSKWLEWIPEFTQFQQFIGDSHDVTLIETVQDNNVFNDVDMLHIDGDHTYEGVKADFENFKSLVKKGGMIVFHDIAGIPDVAKFWNEIKTIYPEGFREIIHEGGWGIGMIIV
jgi:cephalosporin hydroxylase